ncbi:MAG: hypothetical protein A3E85_01535 [Gammaproteobacteria bacterium RIFCSPHIGHO2_12_FULL_45_12]|nr:MAG: hypothetical protein A3E85_01535 [Gammaproteobacteria bacterium RIFCSPHIGHO2_12_FULL_45_12]
MKVYAPGKIILSGEHAVVHGQPALAMAVNRYATVTVTRELLPQILFDLSDIAHHSRLSFHSLKNLKARIKRKYHKFIRGEYSIREVLQKPFELAQFALSVFADSLSITIPHGVKIHLKSNIPIGCGMGSSAATILSVMQAIAMHLKIPVSAETLFALALEAENMQHGYSSGLDLRVALQGGCLYGRGESWQPRAVPTLPMYLVNTGIPQSSTGQCVTEVASFFKSSSLGTAFADVTQAMDIGLQQRSGQVIRDTIQANHRLLIQIGVVPDRVQQFITAIEVLGGAAKICGAGAIFGDQAGVVLVLLEDDTVFFNLCQRYGYAYSPLMGESRGVHVV